MSPVLEVAQVPAKKTEYNILVDLFLRNHFCYVLVSILCLFPLVANKKHLFGSQGK